MNMIMFMFLDPYIYTQCQDCKNDTNDYEYERFETIHNYYSLVGIGGGGDPTTVLTLLEIEFHLTVVCRFCDRRTLLKLLKLYVTYVLIPNLELLTDF